MTLRTYKRVGVCCFVGYTLVTIIMIAACIAVCVHESDVYNRKAVDKYIEDDVHPNCTGLPRYTVLSHVIDRRRVDCPRDEDDLVVLLDTIQVVVYDPIRGHYRQVYLSSCVNTTDLAERMVDDHGTKLRDYDRGCQGSTCLSMILAACVLGGIQIMCCAMLYLLCVLAWYGLPSFGGHNIQDTDSVDSGESEVSEDQEDTPLLN